MSKLWLRDKRAFNREKQPIYDSGLEPYSGDIVYDRLVGAYEHALGKVKEPVLQKKV